MVEPSRLKMIVELVIGIIILVILGYWYKYRKNAGFWTKQGVKVATYPSAHPLGNSVTFCLDTLFGRKNMVEMCIKQSEAMREEKMYGTFAITGHQLVLQDPELIRQVLVKDFNHFVDRQPDAIAKFFNKNLFVDRLWLKNITIVSGKCMENTHLNCFKEMIVFQFM